MSDKQQGANKGFGISESTLNIIDAMPLSCSFWDESYRNLGCNQGLVDLFELQDKQEFAERFPELSPERQPDGQLSAEKAAQMYAAAFSQGKQVFEWMHQTLSGLPLPCEITLVPINTELGSKVGTRIMLGYVRDLREQKITLSKWRAANERTKIMFDTTPLCCNFWDENYNNIDCSQESVNLFGLENKQEYLDRFHDLSPEYQPDGRLSKEKAIDLVKEVFKTGRVVFEWMHQKLNGEPLPCEITLVRVSMEEGKMAVLGYTRDLRELKATIQKLSEAGARTKLMLDTTPLCCNFWDENLNNIDCNQEAVKLFELKDKQEYLERFFELSPEYQPDGRLSQEKAGEMIKEAFKSGRVVFEWMHQKLNAEQVPSEIMLVRVVTVDGKTVVVGYTRDLRELKSSVEKLNQLEQLAFTDSLTGIYNRRYFMQTAMKAFTRINDLTRPMAIIMYDLDLFKHVNDTYGHAAGDEILRSVSAAVATTLRETDLLARFGGEEFIIMVPNSDWKNLIKLASRVREKVADSKFSYLGQPIHVTISLGVATKTEGVFTLEELIKRADQALYQAKANGRNRVEVFADPAHVNSEDGQTP